MTYTLTEEEILAFINAVKNVVDSKPLRTLNEATAYFKEHIEKNILKPMLLAEEAIQHEG